MRSVIENAACRPKSRTRWTQFVIEAFRVQTS